MKTLATLSAGVQLLVIAVTAQADGISQNHARQMTLLYSMAERAGKTQKIYIYDGFRDRDIDRFLDDQFRNMQNVMFTNVIVTDKRGVPLRDPRTGLVVREDDGC